MKTIRRYWYISKKIQMAWLGFENGFGISPFLFYSYLKNVFFHTFFFKFFERPCIYTVEEDGDILLIAPMKYNIKKKNWMLLGDIFGSGEADFLYAQTLSNEKRIQLTYDLISSFNGKFEFSRISEESILFKVCKEMTLEYAYNNSVMILIPEDYDVFNQSLSSSVRQNLRTSYNRMKRDEIFYQLEFYEKGNDNTMEKIFYEIMPVYLTRQRGKYNNHNGFAKNLYSFFYRNLKHDSISLKNSENAVHFVLRINNEIAAFFSGLKNKTGDIIVVPRLAINDKFSFYSPGYLLLNESIKFLKEREVKILDLTRGTEKYKTAFNGIVYKTYDFKGK